jgi:putative hydrolase of the HAD superfamily
VSASRPNPQPGDPSRELTGLVVDWGGVLTAPLDGAIGDWIRADGIDQQHFRDVMRRWVGARPGEADDDDGTDFDSPVHRLERGELDRGQFERLLAAELGTLGSTVSAEGLIGRMLGGLEQLDPRMVDLLGHARAAGLRVALLSNSWGNSYPAQVRNGLFDAVVISGEVGMRKPEERIYRHAADLLGLSTAECVMIDDLPHNVTGAARAGMVGVQHRSYDQTLAELEVLFDRRLY